VSALVPEAELEAKPDGPVTRVVKRALGLGERSVEVRGMDDVMITLARCCRPVRGEEIVGYITRGKGVSVHSAQCPNVSRLMYDSERRIEVEWDASGKDDVYDVKLALDVEDRQGLLAKIVSTISEEKTDIKNVDAKTFEGKQARVTIVVSVADRRQMERVMTRIRKISGVRDVARLLR
jgi:GTP pyrophosphokinase